MSAVRTVPSHTIKLFRIGLSMDQQWTKASWPVMFRFEFTVQQYTGGPLTFRLGIGRWVLKLWVTKCLDG